MFPPVRPDPPVTDAALSRSHPALGTREQSSAPPSPRPLLRRLQRAGRSPRSLLLSKPDRPRVLSHSSEDMPASPCPSLGDLLGTRSRAWTFFLTGGAQKCPRYSRWGCTSAAYSGTISSLEMLVVPCSMHPGMGFALSAARAPCWLLLSLLSASTPRALSAGLLSSHSSPSLEWCQVLLCPKCRIWHLFLFNFMWWMIAQCSNLSRSLCKASSPVRESTASPGLVSSANWLRVQSNSASRWLIKGWSRTGPRIESWGTAMVTGCQTGVAPFTITLWALPFSQCFTHHTVSLHNKGSNSQQSCINYIPSCYINSFLLTQNDSIYGTLSMS